MKIKLVCVGAVRDTAVGTAIERYVQRIPHYWKFDLVVIPDVKTGKAADPRRQKDLEGEKILAEVAPGDFLLLLDEKGREYTSRELSEFIARKAIELPKNLVMVIGGPYGFCPSVYERSDGMLSLSKMTFPHELALLFTVEQLYRAATILRGEPYHHD